MDDFLLETAKEILYEPIKNLLIFLGWKEPKQITLISILLILSIRKLYKIYFPRVRRFLSILWSTKYLAKIWSHDQIKIYTKYFVRPRLSKISPSFLLEDETEVTTDFTKDAIQHFKDRILKSDSDQKFYMILGGSGIGKSAFVVNLLVSYNRDFRNLFSSKRVEAIDLSRYDADEKITELKESVIAKNTILLLDAFDEDEEARINWNKRINELGILTQDFKKVIFTSRIQFFTSEKNEPKEIGIKVSGPQKQLHKVETFYLYPFNQNQINQFLDNKYGKYPFFKKRKQKKKAKKITKSSTKLMERPFLLQHIGDLVQEDEYLYEYQIYNRLISEWIKRESVYVEFKERENYIKNLNLFSLKLAKNMYENSYERKGNHISTDEIKKLCEEHNIPISLLDARSRSLLSRGSDFYKFIHKSLFEFLLAKESIVDPEFKNFLNLNNLPDADKYYRQLSKVDIVLKYLKEEKIRIHEDQHNLYTIRLDYKKYLKFTDKLSQSQFRSGINDMTIQNIFIEEAGKYDWAKLKPLISLKRLSFYNNRVKNSININELRKHLPNVKTSLDQYNYNF